MTIREWYARWFAEEGILGFHLVIGFLVALISGGLFEFIADEVFRTPGIRSLDAQALAISALLHSPGTTGFMEFVTAFGSGWTLTTLSTVVGLWLYFSGSHRRLYTFGAVMAGGNLLNVLLKDVFQRLRPSEMAPLVQAAGYSFPSGHAMGAMLFFGSLAYVVFFTAERHPVLRVLGIVFCIISILLVGGSRIYLGVHYLSDVVTGFLAGLGWLAICISGTEGWIRWRDRRRRRRAVDHS